MLKIKNILASLSVLAYSLFAGFAPVAVHAQAPAPPAPAGSIQNSLDCGANLDINSVTHDASGTACTPDSNSGTKLNEIVTLVINIFSVVVAIVAVIMIIIGGLKYIMSGGDSGNITGAKNTILYAIVGLVIVALAQFIVRFVLEKVSGTT